MISSFYKKFSLNNLQNDKPNGQIATILILVIVVILILILTTVNLGQLSISTTNLSNVADSSALYLASQLATRSYGLYKALGNSTSKCQSGGWASVFFAIVFAVVAVIVCYFVPPLWPYVIPIAATAGAAGGAVGADYAGTSVLQGAIQGFIIGAAIGGGVTLGAEAGAGATSLEGIGADTIIFTATGEAVLTPAAINAAALAMATPMAIGAIAGGTLAAASAVYNAYVADQDQAAAIAAASRSLNGLPDYDLCRESIFLQVFSQTVDDPNKDMDTSDLDGDGKIDEKISHFLYYWDDRIKYLKEVIPTLKSITDNFVNGTLEDFKDYIQNEIEGMADESYDSEGMPTTSYTPGILSKIGSGEDIAWNGSIAEVAEGLNLGFWDPQTEGSLDSIISGFNNFISEAEAIQAIDLDRLTANWQTYIKNFYNEDAGTIVDGQTITDYYSTLEEVKGYLSGWETQIKDARNQLPSCKTGASYSGSDEGGEYYYCQPCYYSTYCANDCIISSGPEMSSVPCKLDSTLAGGSLDYNIDDEITLALNDIDTLISKISDFQDAIKQYAQDMENAYAAIENGYGGLNPATYSWTDSRGEHSIKAEVGSYQLASTITTSSGGWLKKTICI
ncbi:MAG: pilus assembly protein TadG-related protein, partial [Candidatus Contubernalis sp.]|nr:pilus assembly protein TadG-related protein [Candidatus Contubernalis sp.]